MISERPDNAITGIMLGPFNYIPWY